MGIEGLVGRCGEVNNTQTEVAQPNLVRWLKEKAFCIGAAVLNS